MKKNANLQVWVRLALLVAVELAMRAIGLGAVPVGPLNMSFLTLPIAVGAVCLGPVPGMILGAVFGVLSLTDAISGRSAMTGAFFQLSPVNTVILCVGMRMLMGLVCGYVYRLCQLVERKGLMDFGARHGAVLGGLYGLLSMKDAIANMTGVKGGISQLVLVPNVLIAVLFWVLVGYACGHVYKTARKAHTDTWCYFVGAVSAPLLNTLFFMGYIVLVFYSSDFVQNLVAAKGAANPLMFVILLVGVQGMVEAAVCGILGGIISKAVDAFLKRK